MSGLYIYICMYIIFCIDLQIVFRKGWTIDIPTNSGNWDLGGLRTCWKQVLIYSKQLILINV